MRARWIATGPHDPVPDGLDRGSVSTTTSRGHARMQQVLITGGAGFIGSHLADELLAHGYRVRVLDNLVPQVHGETHAGPSTSTPRSNWSSATSAIRGGAQAALRRRRRGLPLRGGRRRRPEHVRDRRVHQRQQPRHRGAARGADRAAGAAAGRRVEHEPLRRRSVRDEATEPRTVRASARWSSCGAATGSCADPTAARCTPCADARDQAAGARLGLRACRSTTRSGCA